MTSLVLRKTSVDLVELTTVETGYELGMYDMRTSHGALLSVRIKNQNPATTNGCTAYVCISYMDEVGVPPISGGQVDFGNEDSEWFSFTTLYGPGGTNNYYGDFPPIEIPAAVQYVAVVFINGDGSVIVEAKLSVISMVEEE